MSRRDGRRRLGRLDRREEWRTGLLSLLFIAVIAAVILAAVGAVAVANACPAGEHLDCRTVAQGKFVGTACSCVPDATP